MRVLHLVDRYLDRGGAYLHLAGLLEEQRRAGLVVAVAAETQEARAPVEVHLVPGLASRERAPCDPSPVVARFRPDVVHLHTVVNPEALEWACGRPAVITVQDHRYFCPTRGKWRLDGRTCHEALRPELCVACFEDEAYFRGVYAVTEARLATLRALRVVTLSRYMARELEAAGVPAAAVTVVPPFVHDLASSGGGGPPCVAVVGRLVESKGVRDAVEAWRRCGTELPLIAAGTGPLRAWIESQGIAVTGWLGRPALGRLLGRARAVLMTPRWQEPFGIAGLEALTLGVPVAAWESGGIAEWHPGPLAAWGDVDAVAGRLREALASGPVPEPERRRLEALFQPADLMRRLLGVYQHAVGLP
ncbi:MAG TPA: glycosyltransferase family 4 protein [Vicinamibacteria bacterium]|nr:glycosyltransferase family 4 protein [Vicinamibacteria bacterium]